MIRHGVSNFGVYSGLIEELSSASGPTCPTDAKAANSARIELQEWHSYVRGKIRAAHDKLTVMIIVLMKMAFYDYDNHIFWPRRLACAMRACVRHA